VNDSFAEQAISRFVDATAQARSLEEVAHRPWPVPDRPWVMGQTWQRLLFAHWRVPSDVLRPHVPKTLLLEEWDGSAWLGITPFRVAGLRVRGLPPLPLASSFHELNCRTYVRAGDRPGIWFFSLDASSRAAVEVARRTYKLPYRFARIDAHGDSFDVVRVGESASLTSRYRGLGQPTPARPDTLEYFLTERYCLYGDDGRLRADIHHPPWPLEAAEGTLEESGISPVPLDGEPLLHYSERQDVVIWSPEQVDEGREH
jgi:uncharacterized protein YqjF (DUF2071 family)